MKYFEVFKAGTYPQGKFTKKEIAQIAKNYDPTFCEAPITIDHQQSGPAYGWVDDVKADGEKLKVSFKEVPKEFEQAVNDGKYKKVSVELYRNLDGKGAYLKAVSFLGAAMPQVKGLEAIKFMEAESDTYEFESDDETENFSEEDIEDLKKQVSDLETQVANFKENNKKLETIKSLKDKISALNDEVATFKEKAQGKEEIEKELSDIKNSIKKREFEEFIEKQIDKGILVPANKNVVLRNLARTQQSLLTLNLLLSPYQIKLNMASLLLKKSKQTQQMRMLKNLQMQMRTACKCLKRQKPWQQKTTSHSKRHY